MKIQTVTMHPQIVISLVLVLVVIVNATNFSNKSIKSQIRLKNKFKPKGQPRKCFGLVCNSISSYPHSYVKQLMRKNKKLYPQLYGTVIEPGEKDMPSPELRSSYENIVEKNMCETRRVTITPKVAYDTDIIQRYIVNIKDHVQSVTFETCVSTNCFGNGFILNYKTSCKQLYNNVQLLYLTEKGALAYGKFTVPSTCVCTYSKIVQ